MQNAKVRGGRGRFPQRGIHGAIRNVIEYVERLCLEFQAPGFAYCESLAQAKVEVDESRPTHSSIRLVPEGSRCRVHEGTGVEPLRAGFRTAGACNLVSPLRAAARHTFIIGRQGYGSREAFLHLRDSRHLPSS